MSAQTTNPAAHLGMRHQPQLLRSFFIFHFSFFILTALALLAAYRLQQPALRADIGGPWDIGFVSLFGGREQNDEASFRWSGSLSALHIYGFEGQPALLRLRMSATRPAGSEPATLQLTDSTQLLGSWTIAPGWREYSLLLPAQPGSEQTLLLRSSTFSPGGRDSRDLGVALDQIRAAGLGLPPSLLPPGERWLFLSLLPPLLLMTLRRSPRLRPAATPSALILATLLTLGVARWPATTAYLLPNLWPALGLLTLALALPSLRALTLNRWPALAGSRAALALGLALSVGGLALLASQIWWVGTALALAGALLLVLSFEPAQVNTTAAQEHSMPPGHRVIVSSCHRVIISLALITALALGLRLWRLDQLPLGIWQDEARHGMGALQVLRDPGYRPVYASDVDLPAGVFYIIAPSLGLFDVSSWSLRLPMALAGALLPLAAYVVARPLLGSTASLIGAALLACASWGISLSRIAWPTIFDPLLLLLALGLLWHALSTRRSLAALLLAALAGLLTGLDGYTYHTGRLAPLFCLWLLLVVGVTHVRHAGTDPGRIQPARDLDQPTLRGTQLAASSRQPMTRLIGVVLAWGTVLVITLTPLLRYAQDNPQGFSKRVSGVALLGGSQAESGSPATLLQANALRYLGMLHIQGDPNGRHHLPGRPFLDPVVGTLFLVGLLWAFQRRNEAAAQLLLGWLALGAVAGIFSVGGPHAMRAVGVLVPSLLLAAIGLREVLAVFHHGDTKAPSIQLASNLGRRVAGPAASGYLSMLIIGIVALLNAWLYFGLMPHDPQHVRAFRPVATRIGMAARTIAQEPNHPTVYLPAGQFEADETLLFTVGVPNIRSLDDADAAPPSGAAGVPSRRSWPKSACNRSPQRHEGTEYFTGGLFWPRCTSSSEKAISTAAQGLVVLLLPGEVSDNERAAALARLQLQGISGEAGGFFPDNGQPLFWIYRQPSAP